MTPRRVLVVLAAPTFGGAANHVRWLHGPLRVRGWDLRVVAPDEPGNVVGRLRDAGVTVHRLPTHRVRATRDLRVHAALAWHTSGEVAALRRLIRDSRSAVVQVHGDLNPQPGIAGHLEGAAVHWQLIDTRTPPHLRRVTMPLVRSLADSIGTIGRRLAEVYPGALSLGDRCQVIYPPADGAAFRDVRARRDAARAELAVPEGAVCIGAIGNRNPQKGHEWLVRAASRARAADRRVVVRILGASSPGHETYETALRAEAAACGLTEADGSFRIVDPGARVPDLIGALDVLAMTSVPNSEGLPTVILEAMHAGLPVVATDVGAVSEAVLDGVTGRVVTPGDLAALAAALAELARDEARRRAWGDAGRDRAVAEFGLDRLVDLYDHCYTLAVTHRATRRRRRALEAYG